ESLSQADVFRADPDGQWMRRDSFPNPDLHLIRPWQVLLAGAGTLGETELYGRCVIADSRLAGKYAGPDVLTVTFCRPGSDLTLFVYASLASSLVTRAIRSLSYGTKILRPRRDMLRRLPVPIADSDTVRGVAALVRETVKHRAAWTAEIAAAKAVVEGLPEM